MISLSRCPQQSVNWKDTNAAAEAISGVVQEVSYDKEVIMTSREKSNEIVLIIHELNSVGDPWESFLIKDVYSTKLAMKVPTELVLNPFILARLATIHVAGTC